MANVQTFALSPGTAARSMGASEMNARAANDAPPAPGESGRPAARHHSARLYSSGFWQAGRRAAAWLPRGLQDPLAALLGDACWALSARRRQAVTRNLLPVLGGDEAAARRLARQVFRQFARKLADLWRFESGHLPEDAFCELLGWEHFEAAFARKRGVLLVTPHLGNWEIGGPLLTRRGHSLKIVTLAEPGGLTEMRQAARARWGIETLVIGDGAFGFVEIIRQLEAGAAVAMLVDRPPPETAVEVPLFGRPFRASIATAELARAAGCALLPVVIVRTPGGYTATAGPEIPYDRASLRERDQRVQLTARILQFFEPAIRRHPDQWFHFAPIWPVTSPLNPLPRGEAEPKDTLPRVA